MDQSPFSATCNILYHFENADFSKISRFTRWSVRFSVRFWGNWVGGDVHCLEDRLVFMMNALNRRYQHDTNDIVIPYTEIQSVRLGRMKGLFKTVDIDSNGNDELAAEIKKRLG